MAHTFHSKKNPETRRWYGRRGQRGEGWDHQIVPQDLEAPWIRSVTHEIIDPNTQQTFEVREVFLDDEYWGICITGAAPE